MLCFDFETLISCTDTGQKDTAKHFTVDGTKVMVDGTKGVSFNNNEQQRLIQVYLKAF